MTRESKGAESKSVRGGGGGRRAAVKEEEEEGDGKDVSCL